MNKLWLCGACVAIGAAFYFCGRAVGMARCRANAAIQSAHAQIQIIKKTEKINETVYRTNLGDIRRIMREKYTIAE